jgi:hypothetical protein
VRRESAKSCRENRVAARRNGRNATLVAVAILVVAGCLLVSRGQAAGTRPVALPGARATASRPLGAAARPKASSQISLASSDLPDDCMPNPAGPPAATYQLGLVGTATNGALDTGSATVANIDAKFCGIVTLTPGTPPCGATGSVNSPMDGQEFGALSVGLTLVPGMTPTIGFVANPGTITGGFSCTSSQNGLAVALDANVSGSTAPLFGVSCTIGPVSIPLTGAVTGPLTATTATLTSNDFSVPAVQPSSTCPAAVAANVDMIAGLPLSAGHASATLPVTASLYQPAP